MTIFWFIIAVAAVVILIVALLFIQQYRTRDRSATRVDPADLAKGDYDADRAKASIASTLRRSSGPA